MSVSLWTDEELARGDLHGIRRQTQLMLVRAYATLRADIPGCWFQENEPPAGYRFDYCVEETGRDDGSCSGCGGRGLECFSRWSFRVGSEGGGVLMLRCLFGIHDWVYEDLVPTGYATCDWGLTPCREFAKRLRCSRCGAEKEESGYTLPTDRVEKDANGWPLSEDGEKLPLRGP